MRFLEIARLAWADLKHDRLVSLCITMSLVAVVAPLLLLFGLKHGVISALQAQLMQDPRHLEVRMLSSGSYDQAWVSELAARPDVSFALGLTRSLNTQADFTHTSKRFLGNVDVLPTTEGDPLQAAIDMSGFKPGQVIFSAQAAQRLNVKPGDEVRLRISRRLGGVDQRAAVTLQVHALMPAAVYGRPAAFVHPELLHAMEWYRDGYAVSAFGASDGLPQEQAKIRYAKARLYASDMDSVAGLEQALIDRNIETSSSLAQIENVKAINYLLTTVFAVIAATAVVGCLASLAGAFLANVRRKRREIATLRLLGVDGTGVSAYIMLQAAALTLCAFVIGLLLYFAGAAVFNHLLGLAQSTGHFVCRITPIHAVSALMLTMLVALLVSFIGAAGARRIQPGETLRET